MKKSIVGAVCILWLISHAYGQHAMQKPAPSGDIVWIWSGDCAGDNRIGLEILLEGKKIFSHSGPICRGKRSSENGRAEFYFKGGHRFQGKYATVPTEKIEGNIWQAGGDPDAIILGISFATKNRILLNTLHIAKPDGPTSSEIDNGIVVRTFPVLRQPGR